mgnify:CR=1 FL=1
MPSTALSLAAKPEPARSAIATMKSPPTGWAAVAWLTSLKASGAHPLVGDPLHGDGPGTRPEPFSPTAPRVYLADLPCRAT